MGTHRGWGEARPSGGISPFSENSYSEKQGVSRALPGGRGWFPWVVQGLGLLQWLERLTEVHSVHAPDKTIAETCPGLKRG